MQCVKLRSVMGSYLNIHLNLFPIYVLLLLLTLSHGRPSAKVREQRRSALLHDSAALTANRHQHQQFNYNKNKWYQLTNLYPPSPISSSASSSSSYSPYFFPATATQLNGGSDSGNDRGISADSNINSVSITSKVNNAKYSKSAPEQEERDEEAHGIISQPVNTIISQSIDDHDHRQEQQVNGIPTTTVDTTGTTNTIAARGATGSSLSSSHQTRKAKKQQMNKKVASSAYSSGPLAKSPGQARRAEEVVVGEEEEEYTPPFVPPSNQSSWYVIRNDDVTGTNTNNPDVIQMMGGEGEEDEGMFFDGEGEAANYYQVGSHQQLETFRQNILKSLGHLRQQQEEEDGGEDGDAFSNPTNITLDYNDEDSLAKYNITREEYLQAYTEYMQNVKRRRLANRGSTGAKDRRRNAVTYTKTYHDNGTDLFSIGSKVLKLFRFEMQYSPTMEGTDFRIQRVVLSLPAMCQLTGQLQNSTDLPDLKQLSEMSTGVDDCENETTREGQRIDLTRNVTAWSVRDRRSSPFIVLAICSRDGGAGGVDSIEEMEEASQQQHSKRHHHHTHHSHGSSLKVVTREFFKPTLEAQLKRRVRRAAVMGASPSTEPSTLRSFTHKRDSGRGRECANTRHGKTCCRRSLKIKFSDLGISDVILEPKEFDAHLCDGRCNARRVAYASTHAMFQHILHQTKGKKVAPRPCCVPTQLTELDVLHLDPNGNRNGGPKLIVTILKDAIVKECGCS